MIITDQKRSQVTTANDDIIGIECVIMNAAGLWR